MTGEKRERGGGPSALQLWCGRSPRPPGVRSVFSFQTPSPSRVIALLVAHKGESRERERAKVKSKEVGGMDGLQPAGG